MEIEAMKGYKAFSKGLVCKDKQYKEGEIFEEKGGNICGPGMIHFCENPLDCLDYYPLVDENGEFSEFAEVEALDEVVTDDNKKYATKKLKIGAKLDLSGFIKASVGFLLEKTEPQKIEDNSSGYAAKIGSSGDDVKIICESDHAVVCCAGKRARVKAPIGT
jgi:hypothetical protein